MSYDLGPAKGHQRREVPLPWFLVRDREQHIVNKSKGGAIFAGPRGVVLRLQPFQRAALIPVAEKLGLREPKMGKDGQPIH
jgi:hypothetical protein